MTASRQRHDGHRYASTILHNGFPAVMCTALA
jgi:hypothetical protein